MYHVIFLCKEDLGKTERKQLMWKNLKTEQKFVSITGTLKTFKLESCIKLNFPWGNI